MQVYVSQPAPGARRTPRRSSPASPATCCSSSPGTRRRALRAQLVGGRGRAAAGAPGERRRGARGRARAVARPAARRPRATSRSRRREIARLEELRLAALEERIEAELALGRHADLRRRARGAGRRAPAARAPARAADARAVPLAAARPTRSRPTTTRARALVDELGIEPGRALRELEQAILRQDPRWTWPRGGRPTAPGAGAGALRRAASASSPSCSPASTPRSPGAGGLCPSRRRARDRQEPAGRGADRPGPGRAARGCSSGRCWEAGGAPAYWPWVQSLRAYLRRRRAGGAARAARARRRELAQLAARAARDRARPAAAARRSSPRARASGSSTRRRAFLRNAAASAAARAGARRPARRRRAVAAAAAVPRRSWRGRRILVVGAYRDVDPRWRIRCAATLAELARATPAALRWAG